MYIYKYIGLTLSGDVLLPILGIFGSVKESNMVVKICQIQFPFKWPIWDMAVLTLYI